MEILHAEKNENFFFSFQIINENKGFYTIYRDVFARLAEEDKSYYDEEVHIPEFGQSDSDYDTVVGPFYGFWNSYCTPRSFVWVEKHDTREAADRYVRRVMDKENKKLRDKAKKERNEEIRVGLCTNGMSHHYFNDYYQCLILEIS